MTPQRFELIAPLLRAQSYIDGVRYSDVPQQSPLNRWRSCDRSKLQGRKTIVDMHAVMYDIDLDRLSYDPWLSVPVIQRARVIIHRSARYQNKSMPWRQVVNAYRNDCLFVGLRDEYEAFTSLVQTIIPHEIAPDLFVLAQWIAGCELFVGNQSCPLAIAEGLGANIVAEIGHPNNCLFERNNRINYQSGALHLPILPSDNSVQDSTIVS